MFYRKYRPQTIEELDNTRVRETLGRALLENKFAQAYLLLGTRGSGKTTTARLIAKVVNCTNRKEGEEPCNECDSCRAIMEGRSLDVIEIDAASNTGVDDIRELRERVKLAPSGSKYKVYIIDEVHMLSTSAFNALLKTLEEPPEHVIFVLATTDPQKLPATIVSRCLVYDFGRASVEEAVRSLRRKVDKEKLEAGEDVLELIAKSANGSFRDADKLLEQLAMQGKKITPAQVREWQDGDLVAETTSALLAKISAADKGQSLIVVEQFTQKNGKVKDLMVSVIDALRRAMLQQNGIDVDGEQWGFSSDQLRRLLEQLLVAMARLRESPVPQLPLEMAIVEFCQTGVQRAVSKGDEVNNEKIKKAATPDDVSMNSVRQPAGQINPVGRNSGTPGQRIPPELKLVTEKWPEVLVAVKPFNNSLVALLRASRPKELVGSMLTLEVFYKFHKDKLSEEKNCQILERVVSGIMGQEIKVKFVLSEKGNK